MLKHTAPTLAGATASTPTATVSQRPLRPLAISAAAISAANASVPTSSAAVTGSGSSLSATGTVERLVNTSTTSRSVGNESTRTPASGAENDRMTSRDLQQTPKIANGNLPRGLSVTSVLSASHHQREPSQHHYQNTPHLLHHHHTSTVHRDQSSNNIHSSSPLYQPQNQHTSSNYHQHSLSASHLLQTQQQQPASLGSSYHQPQTHTSLPGNRFPTSLHESHPLGNSSQHQQTLLLTNSDRELSCLPKAITSTTNLTGNGANGVKEALTSLGLLCLVSLLLALLSLIFLLKISPGGRDLLLQPAASSTPLNSPSATPPSILAEDYVVVYDVTLALCALSLSLNLCCLLVCAVQFLFAVKLVRNTSAGTRGNKYLQKSSASRVCAVGGFFVSIPVFLTGIILYTFTQFHSTPAIVTSVLIGVGIVFCGGAMVHNVFVWQREKTMGVLRAAQQQRRCLENNNLNSTNIGMNDNSTRGPLPPPVRGSVQSLTVAVGGQKDLNTGSMFLNHTTGHHTNAVLNQSISHSLANTSQHTPLTPHHTPVTPVPITNHHLNFSHYLPSSSYLRPATSTPPTPKNVPSSLIHRSVLATAGDKSDARETSGSISPTAAGDAVNSSSISSPHELSTLV